MKRLVATIVFGSCALFAFGQAPFTIVRPLDGAKVREKIRIQMPKASIQDGQYVGIFLDGKFLEARILDLNGKFFEYILDSKERKIADGTHKVEVVLYADMGDKVRVVDRSSIDVVVANSTSIPVPSRGFSLRYKFVPGREYSYLIEQRVKVSTITEAQAKLGGRSSTIDVEGESVRMLYSIDNAYGNGDGLVRMQALPEKGKDYVWLTVVGEEEPAKYYKGQMHPIYMRLSNTGMEQFGSIPVYIPVKGSGALPPSEDLYAAYPLPTLPSKSVRPGDSWNGRFQFGKLDVNDFLNLTSVTSRSQARGELIGMEWELGHPCAKIRYSIASNSGLIPAGAKSKDGMGQDRVQLEETFWFALDLGTVVKIIDDFQVDIRTAEAPAATGGGAAGAGAPGSAGRPGGPAAAGQSSGGGSAGVGQIGPLAGSGTLNQGKPRGGPGGETGNPQDRFGTGGQGGRLGGGGQTGGRTAAPAIGGIRYLRYRVQRIQTLE